MDVCNAKLIRTLSAYCDREVGHTGGHFCREKRSENDVPKTPVRHLDHFGIWNRGE